MSNSIYVIKTEQYSYPNPQENFRPSCCYPEYLYKEDIAKLPNHIYDLVRTGLQMQGFDSENFNTTVWNPFGELIKPGDRVLIKPNLVLHENISGCGEDCLYTNPSVVAAIIDYVLIALKGTGKIIVGDAPLQECIFDVLLDNSGYRQLINYYKEKGIDIEIVDFRNVKTYVKDGVHYLQSENKEENGIVVQMNESSLFFEKSKKELKRLRITNYDPRILQKHHNTKKHEYKISKEILRADVVINVPKPKTHRKSGVTAALKNLIGINANKEYLPHHTLGSISEGGDAYKNKSLWFSFANYILDKKNIYNNLGRNKISQKLDYIYTKIYENGKRGTNEKYWEGSWYGNDTIWRTIIDLNRILLYADKNGNMTDTIQRKTYIVGDMIISGEKEGPLEPTPKNAGIILFGTDPVCFDKTVVSLMGFNYKDIPLLHNDKLYKGKYAFCNYPMVKVISNKLEWNNSSLEHIRDKESLTFEPSAGWAEKLGDPNMLIKSREIEKNKKKVIVFGAGIRGIYVVDYLRKKNIQVDFFCDNDVNKQGKEIFDSILCIAPKDIDKASQVVITTRPKYNKEIIKQLESIGIQTYIFCN